MKELVERARRLASFCELHSVGRIAAVTMELANALEQSEEKIKQARREALEECAVYLEGEERVVRLANGILFAQRIRNLIEKKGTANE